jgi:integrase
VLPNRYPLVIKLMPTVKLTDAAIQRFKVPHGARVDYFDASLPGFALRVAGPSDRAPEGRRTWTLFYRFAGTQKRLSFEPPYPALGLAAGRKRAGDALAMLSEGKDPAAAKAATKEAAAQAPDTIAKVVDLFIQRNLEAKGRAPRYIEETRRNFGNHVLPRWGKRDIKTITRRDVAELLDAVMDVGSKVKRDGKRLTIPGGPIAANRTLAAIRALFNFALRRGIIDSTPAALVERPGKELRRDRTLSTEEMRVVWGTSGALGYPFGPFFQLALITGQRRNELARMRWADLDLDAAIWTLPAEATKARRAHVVPLAPLAIEILNALPRKAHRVARVVKPSPYVFTTAGGAPISGFSKAKPRLDEAIKVRNGDALAPWVIHDLRRTAATEMGRLGVSRFLIGKVLNHADRSITGIYDRHEYLQEKRQALETWAMYLHSLIPPSGANAVQLRVGPYAEGVHAF